MRLINKVTITVSLAGLSWALVGGIVLALWFGSGQL
ncbi:hypothetical protein FF80_03318 [Devosia sp. LC5]|nr:hypothetical protein FF80_03318 [Devosia sp. LC5]